MPKLTRDHVAYQMVQPRWVAEITCLDLVSQSTRGAPIQRMALDWDSAAKKYRIVRRLPLVSVISPQFVRLRDDKGVNVSDIRVTQVSELVDVPLIDRDAHQMTLPSSELLAREVYTKTAKGETMVRKFVMWQTNKADQSEEYPAFVIHFTDYSPNRATPLAREVRVSNSRDQIQQLWEAMKAENIKKGWEKTSLSWTSERARFLSDVFCQIMRCLECIWWQFIQWHGATDDDACSWFAPLFGERFKNFGRLVANDILASGMGPIRPRKTGKPRSSRSVLQS